MTPRAEATSSTGAAAAGSGASEHVVLHVPVDVRSVALAVLAALASIYTLHWASAVFIPLMVGLLLSYALSPVVDWLQKRGVPRVAAAAVLLALMFTGTGVGAFALSDDANDLLASLPAAVQKMHTSIRNMQGSQGASLATVQKAASQLEKVAAETAEPAPVGRGVQRVVIEKPKFDIQAYLWSGTLEFLRTMGQLCVMALIAFFLLASGDTFRRKMVKLAGPTLSRKKLTLEALNEIHQQIQRYMLVQLFTSAIVGVATWACFLAVGMEHAAVWGVAAGVLNLVPYLGNILVSGGSALAAFMQFGTLEMALAVAAISFVINSLEGFLLTPWLTSRANKMNAVAVFVGVLAWGWLWGAWGLLLAVPVLVIVKAVCDRVEDLNAVGELLGQ